ncbi:uncharacterized protein C2orf42 homolog [Genypterus blacodes]|uniref:uncharacterized protein C2orf42 homolog n=1 Tax=Genypterus blacodes TaxID=154954 RepID=UPI003F7761EA
MVSPTKMETEVLVTSTSRVASSSTPLTPTAHANLAAKQKESRRCTPAFLSNLGKATLRGIRRCPQCGVYNGTRGLSCKNKACGIALRDGSAAVRSGKKCMIEVVKVIIDSGERGDVGGEEREEEEEDGVAVSGSAGGVQVFSVCQKGRGATSIQFGFVELVPTHTAIATGDGATLVTRINLGRCFLPSCRHGQRSSNQSQTESVTKTSKQASSSDSICVHIKQAMECQSHATPLTLKSSVLEGLQASIQAREELWRLATESPGPLVQRVAKDTLVVKCHTDSNHPLGLLHLTVGAGGLSEGGKREKRSREVQPQQGLFHCACQASGRRGRPGADGSAQPGTGGSVTSDPCLHFYACVCAFASDDKLSSEFAAFINYTPSGAQPNADCRIICSPEKCLQQAEPNNSVHKGKRLRLDESLAGSGQVVDEHTVVLGFHQWLASVTERIHHTMHYQSDGRPEALVFYIPQEFFDALQCRLSMGSKKRRLPNFTTAFVRNDGLPLGSLSKYTWHINNLMQVKRIFDTPELPLELTQSFVKNIDGSYLSFCCPEPLPEPELPEGFRSDRPQAIRPMELRTFLKVGPHAADQKDSCPFVIEWIPDVLPRSRVGELRICFEFGHQQSGQPEHCDGLAQKNGAAERGGCTPSGEVTHSKSTQTFEVAQVVV